MNTETTNDPRAALQEGERMVARVWRLLALRGVLATAREGETSCSCGPTR